MFDEKNDNQNYIPPTGPDGQAAQPSPEQTSAPQMPPSYSEPASAQPPYEAPAGEPIQPTEPTASAAEYSAPPYSAYTAPQGEQSFGDTGAADGADFSSGADHQGYGVPQGYGAPQSYGAPAGQPAWNKVNYTPTVPVDDYRPASKGLKVFAFVMAVVIVLSAACVTGYFLGKNSVSTYSGTSVNVDLAAKPADTDQMTAAQVYEEVNQSIVGIRVYNSQGSITEASGVIYSEDGYIVTNDHIYSEVGAPNFKIYMYDGTERTATYVAGDTVSDLAVLKLDDASDIQPAVLGDSNELFCGENVVAIGRPSDATTDSSITSGIISLTSRRIKTTSSYSARLIQTDSAINPGSSGGALVNMYGQVVGITSSKLAGIDYDAVGFAIPTRTVKRVVEQLISDGKVTDRAKLGITYNEINSVTAEISGMDNVGLYIVTVAEDSDLYGKIGEGDVITHINGTAITSDDVVLDVIENCVAGDTVTLTIVNSRGNTHDYTVTLSANVGESSYSSTITASDSSQDDSSSSSDGTFDFPFGE